MKATAWIATLTIGEFSDTAVYFLGAFCKRKDAEAAVEEKIVERQNDPDEYRRIPQMGEWIRSECDSIRSSENRYIQRGEPASAAVTEIATNVRMELALY